MPDPARETHWKRQHPGKNWIIRHRDDRPAAGSRGNKLPSLPALLGGVEEQIKILDVSYGLATFLSWANSQAL